MSYDISLIIEPAATAETVRKMLRELSWKAYGSAGNAVAKAHKAWTPEHEGWEPDGTAGGYGCVYDRNYTSNVAPMWRDAGIDLCDFDGKAARELAGPLGEALAVMAAEPRRFEALNPPNGWGDFAGCFELLLELWLASLRFPYATVKVSW